MFDAGGDESVDDGQEKVWAQAIRSRLERTIGREYFWTGVRLV